jgi:hypothetical protein
MQISDEESWTQQHPGDCQIAPNPHHRPVVLSTGQVCHASYELGGTGYPTDEEIGGD